MTTNPPNAQDPVQSSSEPPSGSPGPAGPPGPPGLTIGELAVRTGISAATLRMWEVRHGFPRARRLPSGHRRYDDRTVDQVKEVQRRREAGVRLDAAVSQVVTAPQVPAPSVYAELRRRHPHLLPHRLRKSTLLALSWALEDECCARAQRPWLFGAFQDQRFLRQALPRWRDLARTARGAWALARSGEDVAPPAPGHPGAGGALVRVTLPDSAPMSREWALACVAPDFPAVLAAWELPGQEGTPDRDRLFESMWSLEAEAARDAGLVCARVVGDLGHDTSAALADLRSPTAARSHELRHAVGLFNRVVAYVDQLR